MVDEKMTLEKAIELLTQGSDGNLASTWKEYSDALKLGIEAMKEIHALRAAIHIYKPSILPGETKEEEVSC